MTITDLIIFFFAVYLITGSLWRTIFITLLALMFTK